MALFFARFHGVTLSAPAGPFPSLIAAISAADHGDAVAHHKGRIEAHAKLADDLNILFGLVVLLKVQRTAFRNRTQVVFQLVLRHAAAIVRDGQRPRFLIRLD